jgi:hypothetical protein
MHDTLSCLLFFRGILHDETYFSNPLEFIPERHLPGSKETAEIDVHDVFWGWGRRYVVKPRLPRLLIF